MEKKKYRKTNGGENKYTQIKSEPSEVRMGEGEMGIILYIYIYI